MKVKIVFVVVCTICQFSQIVIADLVPKYIEEVVGFCENNGHKYLKIDGHAVENQKNILMMKQGKYRHPSANTVSHSVVSLSVNF